MIIPPNQINPDTLRRLVEELVTRDGTELSDADRKIGQVLVQLRTGRLLLDFDTDSNSATLVTPTKGKHQSPMTNDQRNSNDQ